jgi:hypothetical protein
MTSKILFKDIIKALPQHVSVDFVVRKSFLSTLPRSHGGAIGSDSMKNLVHPE